MLNHEYIQCFRNTSKRLKISNEYQPFELGASLAKYDEKFPSLEQINLAIIGVPENLELQNEGTIEAPNQIRKELYKLVSNTYIEKSVVDLGNLKSGETFDDTLVGLKDIVEQLHEQNIVSIVIGGSYQLGQALYESFANHNQSIEISYISSRIPILEGQLLDGIIRNEPNHLLRLNALAFQGHYSASQNARCTSEFEFWDISA